MSISRAHDAGRREEGKGQRANGKELNAESVERRVEETWQWFFTPEGSDTNNPG